MADDDERIERNDRRAKRGSSPNHAAIYTKEVANDIALMSRRDVHYCTWFVLGHNELAVVRHLLLNYLQIVDITFTNPHLDASTRGDEWDDCTTDIALHRRRHIVAISDRA